MAYINSKHPWGGPIGVLLSTLLIFGCAANETVKKDTPFEKWATMAETQTGRSPAPRDRSKSIAQEFLKGTGEAGDELKAEPIRELPTQLVTLKLRQADIKTVLRSLARIVDKNVIVKSEIKGEMTIDFKDVPWNQAFNGILRTQGLTYVWEGDIIRVTTLDDMEQDLKRKTQEMGIKWVAPLLTIVVPIDYIASDKLTVLKGNLETFLTRSKEDKPRGSVQVNEYSNSLIISAIREDLLKMMPIIEKIDKPTPQIQIRANIVETSKDTARNLGIQWGGMYSPRIGNHDLWITPGGSGGSTTANPLAGGYSPTGGYATGISGQGYGVNFPVAGTAMAAAGGAASLGLLFGSIGGNILDLQLNALQKDGKLNILSSPSITTMDNQLAFTENGEKVPYSTIDTSVNPPTRTVKFEDAVLRLEITPHVIDGRNLSMKILVKKDEVDTSRTVEGNPYIIKKQTSTSLIVQDGETIVISGLTKQRGLNSVSGVPGLKDIPFLGWLFKGEGKSESMEEVLIFITPKILPETIAAVKPVEGERPAGTDAGGKPSAEKAPKP
ncbi:MAG: type IV pilus secretin PilQ [Deltaproteobacteria bacterium]|nr:type IV pilus secretin PilQ [Deltaproteobacteria bacterium]